MAARVRTRYRKWPQNRISVKPLFHICAYTPLDQLKPSFSNMRGSSWLSKYRASASRKSGSTGSARPNRVLREDEPHPMRAFLGSRQLGQDAIVAVLLGRDEAGEIVGIVHA